MHVGGHLGILFLPQRAQRIVVHRRSQLASVDAHYDDDGPRVQRWPCRPHRHDERKGLSRAQIGGRTGKGSQADGKDGLGGSEMLPYA